MNTRSRKSSTGKRDATRTSSLSAAPTSATKSARRTQSKNKKHPQKEKEEGEKETARKITECVTRLPGFEEQGKLMRSLIASTVKHIESNSILICGPRGCGKSTFVEQCLKSECDPDHTETLHFSGFMDTDATKLFDNMRDVAESDSRSVSLLMDSLRQKCASSQTTVVVILDEFDRFCKHTDQTFLYNMFDLAQKCCQLCIIGITTRLDCLELLEKRVKSRMNQTVINLNCPFRDFAAYSKFASSISSLVGNDKVLDEQLLKTQFSRNVSLRNLKHTMIETIARNACPNQQPKSENSVVSGMISLSHMEFLILVVADTYCKNCGVKALPCDAILREMSKFTGRTRITRDLAYKLIDNLVLYGFLNKISTRDHHFLNDWTMLHLNFGTDDLKDAYREIQSSFPAHLQVLVNIR